MKAVYIIVEGKSEFEFVNKVLTPYLSMNIDDIRAIMLNTSKGQKGGDVSYSRFKINAVNLLKSRKDLIVTSLIDFFKLKTNFPSYDSTKNITDKNERVGKLENAIANDINYDGFIPYIQLHEFEALLFSDIRGFEKIPDIKNQSIEKIREVMGKYPNPEMINDGLETAPSKRLEKIIGNYQKVIYGTIICQEIGIETIINKCPRFGEWVNKIIEMSEG